LRTVSHVRASIKKYQRDKRYIYRYMNPISILLICQTYPPVIGGSEIEAQRVCEALIARGHRVQVVCAGGDPMPAVRDWIDPKGIQVRLYGGRWRGKMRDRVFALRVAGMLIRERKNYDIVYFLMQGLHLAVGLPIVRLLHKPVVAKIAGSGVLPLMNKSVVGRFELECLQRVQRLMILNDGMRQEAIDHGLSANQLMWMPNPVDTDEFAPGSKGERSDLRSRFDVPLAAPVVLYCGRLAPEKALGSLLDAFAIVLQRLPEARLVLVGDGSSRSQLEQQALQLGIHANVRFTGAVHPSQVSSWLKIADVFALVSPSEGFPCAVAEALSAGLPCVVSNIPANRQLIKPEEHGLLVPVGNATAIAEAIERILTDGPGRVRMGQAARKCIVDNYGTSKIADRYETLFRVVLGHDSPRSPELEPATNNIGEGMNA
jgi:glycosyltransferase involved in cell wall biosynthesis